MLTTPLPSVAAACDIRITSVVAIQSEVSSRTFVAIQALIPAHALARAVSQASAMCIARLFPVASRVTVITRGMQSADVARLAGSTAVTMTDPRLIGAHAVIMTVHLVMADVFT